MFERASPQSTEMYVLATLQGARSAEAHNSGLYPFRHRSRSPAARTTEHSGNPAARLVDFFLAEACGDARAGTVERLLVTVAATVGSWWCQQRRLTMLDWLLDWCRSSTMFSLR